MSTLTYPHPQENESVTMWFWKYVIFCILIINTILLATYAIKETNPYITHYKHIAGYVTIIAMPFIIINLIYSLAQFKMNLPTIILKMILSVCLSLLLLRATCEIKPFSEEDISITLYSLAMFISIMLFSDISRNIAEALPGAITRVLLVGNEEFLSKTQTLINTVNSRVQLAGALPLDSRNSDNSGTKISGIFDAAKAAKANMVAISLSERRGMFPLQEMLNCKLSGIQVLDAPGIYERITGKLLIENTHPSWFIFCDGFRITPLLTVCKRLADALFSLLGLTLCLPFAPLVLLAIKLDSPGPALFRQERVGQGDRPFTIYKLRTMRQDAEQRTGAVWAAAADSRVTRLGRFLRKSRIDELPQLFNVLTGEMSLIGPRPERPEFVNKLKEIIPYYSERHFVKPGITGWAQVSYPYGASVEDALEKLRYDMYYIKNISLLLDIRIIFKTIGVVLLRKGGR